MLTAQALDAKPQRPRAAINFPNKILVQDSTYIARHIFMLKQVMSDPTRTPCEQRHAKKQYRKYRRQLDVVSELLNINRHPEKHK